METSLTKEIYNFLVLHIIEIRNKKISIANRYSAGYDKYTRALDFINTYIMRIENFLDKVMIADGSHIPPLVIIGSVVDVSGPAEN